MRLRLEPWISAGARVALVARDEAGLRATAVRLAHEPVVVPADLRDASAPARVAGAVLDALDRVDILVNNAAMAARLATVDTDAALIDDLLAVNVRAPLLLIAALVPSMVDAGTGFHHQPLVGLGLIGTPRRAAYAASKGALDAATRSLAIELGPSGIRVNSVAPGVVDTALWEKNKSIPGVIEGVEAQTPLRRWAQPDDIADVIVFLSSDAARFITGETICADGGMARTLELYAGPV